MFSSNQSYVHAFCKKKQFERFIHSRFTRTVCVCVYVRMLHNSIGKFIFEISKN